MKCIILYCNKDAKCRDMCLKHYEQMSRVGRIVSTELEDWMVYPPEKRWWEHIEESEGLKMLEAKKNEKKNTARPK